MAFYRCGGGGIPSSLKTDMNAVFNKKFGTSGQNYPPKQWPDDVNLLGPLPEGTASGSIAHITDGADEVPIKSWEVEIAPTLTGKSAIECTQTGRNLVDGTNFTRGLPSTTIGASIETIIASTRYAYFGVQIKGGNYTISSVSNDTDYFWNILIFGYTNGVLSVYTNTSVNTSKTVDFSACDYIRLAIGTRSASYQVPTDLTEYGTIQLEVGSTATIYEPYTTPTTHTASLGRTIYGGTADVVKGTGTETHGIYTVSGSETGYYLAGTNNNGNRIDFPLAQAQTPLYTGGLSNIGENKACLNSATWTIGAWCVYSSRIYIVVPNEYTTYESALQYLVDNNATFVFPLSTATDFTFTPITPTPETALGVNNFWADTGDSSVTYRADINLALGGQ